jgi:ABC-type glycerol-3-phosphate transport system substrate-binding protein
MRNLKRLGAAALAAVMALSVAGCGSKSTDDTQSNSTSEMPEYVYVPEYVELGDDIQIYNSYFTKDKLYYTSYDWSENGGNSFCMHEFSLTDKKEISSSLLWESDEDTPASRWVSSYIVTDDGKLITIESVYDYSDENNPYSAYMLCEYDADYNRLTEVDAGEASGNSGDDFYVNSIAADSDGRIYLFSDNFILLFDADLNYSGKIDVNGEWFNSVGTGKDGKVYASVYDDNSGMQILKEVDFDKKSYGTTYSNFLSDNSGSRLVPGIDSDLLVNDGTKVYEYSLDSQSTTELFTWLDSDIFGDYVRGMSVTDDGQIVVVLNDWTTDENELIFLTKTKSSEVAQKEQITIGALYDTQEMLSAAVAFNKQSTKYHVSVKYYRDTNDYSDTAYSDAITAMNNDLVSSSCPDLVEVSSINIPQLAAKGVFEDLTAWLDKSSSLNKSDYYENILDAATYDGTLVYIPKNFSIQTLAGRSSVVGDKRGWSLDDIIKLANDNPDAQLLEYATKSSMLYYLMAYNQDQFIDYNTGKCSFDSDDFKKILEFVASFPDDYDWSEDGDSTPTMLRNGSLLLYSNYINELEDIQLAPALFDDDVTFIGYPTVDGSVGCMLNTSGGYAMTSKSQHKEGAWEFIEFYQTMEDTIFSWGFPSKKADMEELIDEALNVEYVTDENGEYVLDEDGNLISVNGHGGMGWDDWEYTYHDSTQEEIDLLLELISEATPAANTDDQIMNIITEETESYFAGQKSVDDVAGVIQSRIQLYINENS